MEEPAASPISSSGFQVLQVEGEDDVQILNTQPPVLQNINDDETEEGELVEKEDGEKCVAVSHVGAGKVTSPSLDFEITGKVAKEKSGRNRSRSKGPPKPIINRHVSGSKGHKNTSSRK